MNIHIMNRVDKINYMYDNLHYLTTIKDRIEFSKVLFRHPDMDDNFVREKPRKGIEIISHKLTDNAVGTMYEYMVRKIENMDKIRNKALES